MKSALAALLLTAACGNDRAPASPDAPPPPPIDAPAVPAMVVETALTVELALDPVANTLLVTARDGTTPVITDLWLYTVDDTGAMTPLSGTTSTAARKSPDRMLPATIGNTPSGLTPPASGLANGLMTNTVRGNLDQGAFVSAITGTVTVTLPAAPAQTILVIAGVEDQRYAGAAAIQPDGTPGIVPAGVGAPETHARVVFADVAQLLHDQCGACHQPGHTNNADFYKVAGTRDQLVDDNFALGEQTLACQTANPGGGPALDACIQAITKAQFLVEPGAPAVSDLLQRARPDENHGTSPQGLVWYGGKGSRYNATYGDRRMPSTAETSDATMWLDAPTYFDDAPADYQRLYDWVAQGCLE